MGGTRFRVLTRGLEIGYWGVGIGERRLVIRD